MHGQPAPNGADDSEQANKKYWFLNIRRYRSLFNVDTDVSVVDTCHTLVYCTGTKSKDLTVYAGHLDQAQRLCHWCLQGRLL